MNIAQIRTNDVANGEGIRVSLFVSGCYFNCYNCFNKEYQDFTYGNRISNADLELLQNELNRPEVRGLSILGGEPMEHSKALLNLLKLLHFREEQDIWLWSGYTLEKILLNEDKTNLLMEIDVLVDGLFKQELKDLTLKFRGSSNQRIIDVQETLNKKEIIPYYKGE